eukprot:TRINITY_DN1987_c2_g1_i1.p1 TRINITY_DN1987_c2_g1~~TRINITY_DN1987_c2_g1_i1.p1  ORF type:complete len:466 (+),score=110.51 TRINITY_DN1987_c2_g1_i1:193-1398(+)
MSRSGQKNPCGVVCRRHDFCFARNRALRYRKTDNSAHRTVERWVLSNIHIEVVQSPSVSMSTVFAANPFELLGEDDSGEGVATGKVVAQPKKEEKPAAKPAAIKPKEEAKPAARKTGEADNKDSRPKGDSRPDRRPKDLSRTDRGDEVGAGSPGQERPFRPRGDRPNGGERRERRERTENGAAAPRGRVFDRRSGTGRGREEKRGGAGRGNWGSVNDEEKAAAPSEERKAETTEDVAEGEATEAGESTETAAAEPAPKRELTPEELERQKEREREEKLMTLDEYLKVKKGVNVALPEMRKAGEGEDQKKWAKYTAAKNDKDEEESAAAKPTKEKKAKEPTKVAADPALLKFKSEAQRRARESRDRFREERSDRPPRPAPQQQARKAPEPAFGQADFPALKA